MALSPCRLSAPAELAGPLASLEVLAGRKVYGGDPIWEMFDHVVGDCGSKGDGTMRDGGAIDPARKRWTIDTARFRVDDGGQ